MRGNYPSDNPPLAHITLPEVLEALNNDKSFKIVRGVQERDLSPDTRVLLKLVCLGEIRLEQRPDPTAADPDKALYEVLVKTASIQNQILIPESLRDSCIRAINQAKGTMASPRWSRLSAA